MRSDRAGEHSGIPVAALPGGERADRQGTPLLVCRKLLERTVCERAETLETAQRIRVQQLDRPNHNGHAIGGSFSAID